ncbi:MAG: hypothetical protein GY751_15295 [Bacteroidetes bacterium]|nr:hypothetical protein [Bacteroidota bacterium]
MIKVDKPDDNQLHSVLNFFGAHPNRMGASVISSDTRGAACDSMEQYLPGNGIAIFAQNAPGDIDGEGFYRHQTDTANYYVHPPAYSYIDKDGQRKKYPTGQRVLIEGQILMEQSFETIRAPDEVFEISGPIDCELIYINMDGQRAPKGRFPETLQPLDYYKNTYYLLGGFGKFGSLFKPELRYTHTSPPTIGMSAIARVNDRMIKLMTNLELTVRYLRLFFSGFDSEGFDNTRYVWNMYRAQGKKTVMLEGGPISSALGFRIGGMMFNAFAGQDPILLELARDKEIGVHDEHSIYPMVMPLQVMILGNVAIVGVSGEPGNIVGQRIERTVQEILKDRGVKRVIVNGYSNENTGYIFTPEEYEHQYVPQQCGFVLYGKWTSPVVRYNFEKMARAMLLPKSERHTILDYTTQAPQFSDEWYEKSSYQRFLQPVKTHKQKKTEKKNGKPRVIRIEGLKLEE